MKAVRVGKRRYWRIGERTATLVKKKRWMEEQAAQQHPPVLPSTSSSWHHWHFPSLTSGKFFNRLSMTQPDQTLPVMRWKMSEDGGSHLPEVGRTTSPAPRRDAAAGRGYLFSRTFLGYFAAWEGAMAGT